MTTATFDYSQMTLDDLDGADKTLRHQTIYLPYSQVQGNGKPPHYEKIPYLDGNGRVVYYDSFQGEYSFIPTIVTGSKTISITVTPSHDENGKVVDPGGIYYEKIDNVNPAGGYGPGLDAHDGYVYLGADYVLQPGYQSGSVRFYVGST